VVGGVGPKMDDASGRGTDGACLEVCDEAVGEYLALVPVILRSER
jgi:hypothetical protein